MNLIPYFKTHIFSQEDKEFLKERLKGKTEPWQNAFTRPLKEIWYNRYSDPLKFELKICKDAFTLRRINDRFLYNGFRPIVRGRFKLQDNRTRIDLTFRQHLIVIFFLAVFTLVFPFLSFISLKTSLVTAVIVFGVYLGIYSIILFGYNTERKYYIKFINDTFNANLIIN